MVRHVVVDAGPLIHLTQADARSLLDAFETVTIPQAVREEVDGDEVLDALSEVDHAVEELTQAAEDVPTLDWGETAALNLARRRRYLAHRRPRRKRDCGRSRP